MFVAYFNELGTVRLIGRDRLRPTPGSADVVERTLEVGRTAARVKIDRQDRIMRYQNVNLLIPNRNHDLEETVADIYMIYLIFLLPCNVVRVCVGCASYRSGDYRRVPALQVGTSP